MNDNKLFTIVGTTVDAKGNRKMRWANDLVSRIKNLAKAEHTEINLLELEVGLPKLEAAEYFLEHGNLNDDEKQVVEGKIAEKSKSAKTVAIKATLTSGKASVSEKEAITDSPDVETKAEA